MTIFAIAGLSVAISCSILAVIALLFGRTPMQRLLVYFNIACALWGFGSFLAGIARSDADGILAWRIANSGGFFLGPLFYHFVTLFTRSGHRKFLYCAYIQAAGCALLGLSTELLFNKTRYVFGAFYNVVTPHYLVCIGIYLLLVFLSYYKLIKFRRATKGYRRTQADYIIFGFSFGFLGGTSTFFPEFHIDLLYPFGNFGIVIYSAVLCYAILHHHIIDFHLAVRKSLTCFLSIGLLYGIFLLSVFTFTKALSRFLYMTSSTSTIVSTLLAAVLFTPLNNRVQQFASRVFFRTSYDYASVVRETGRELASSIDIRKTYRLFTDTFIAIFKLRNACLLTLRDGYFETAYSVDNASHLFSEDTEALIPETAGRGKRLPGDSPLAVLAREGGVLIKDNLSLLDDQKHGEIVAKEMQNFGGELAAPVFVDKELMFLLVLGDKLSGDSFTSEDIDLVATIASQASLALKNARLFDELRLRLEEIMQYQKNLAEQKERLAVTLASIGDAVIATDTEGTVMLINRVAEELTGWSREEATGKPLSETVTLLDESTREQSDSPADTVIKERVLSGHFANALLVARDGTERIVEISGALIRDIEEKTIGAVLVFRDVTERKRAEQEIREKQQRLHDMALELSMSEERERYRIATELHDTLGQDLTLARLRLGMLAKSGIPDEHKRMLDAIREPLETAINRVRSIIRLTTSPPILESAGLEAALKWLGRQMETEYALRVDFTDDLLDKTLPRAHQTEIYNTVRELLINVVKHANMDSAGVSVSREEESFVVTVEDHGKGYRADVDAVTANGGFGLFNIRRRIVCLGGTLDIDSSPGAGTRVTIRMPLRPCQG